MKKPILMLLAMAIIALTAQPLFANTETSTPISGTYEGSMQTKAFFENNTSGKTTNTTNYDIQLLFNGSVFIYQGDNVKCMGNYKINGDTISFEITSTKGDAEKVNSIFSNTFKFSKSGGKLMLISNENVDGKVVIYTLSKSNG
ncbi:MAG: hypothetical protein R2730_04085 [Chitinophagales bacterium]